MNYKKIGVLVILHFMLLVGSVNALPQDSEVDLVFNYDTTSTTFYPNTFQTLIGTETSDNVTYIKYYDDIYINISETSGSPSLDVRINFTGVSDFNSILMRLQYAEVATTHDVYLQLYNYNTDDWDLHYDLADSSSLIEVNQYVSDSENHVQNGLVQMRIYHGNNGNTNDKVIVDYINLLKGTTAITTNQHDAMSGRNSESNHPWAYPRSNPDDFISSFTESDPTAIKNGTSANLTDITAKSLTLEQPAITIASPTGIVTATATYDEVNEYLWEYFSDGATRNVRIFAYSSIGGGVYSTGYIEGSYTDDATYENTYYINFSWEPVVGATEYFLVFYDDGYTWGEPFSDPASNPIFYAWVSEPSVIIGDYGYEGGVYIEDTAPATGLYPPIPTSTSDVAFNIINGQASVTSPLTITGSSGTMTIGKALGDILLSSSDDSLIVSGNRVLDNDVSSGGNPTFGTVTAEYFIGAINMLTGNLVTRMSFLDAAGINNNGYISANHPNILLYPFTTLRPAKPNAHTRGDMIIADDDQYSTAWQGDEVMTNPTFSGSATGWTLKSPMAYSSNTVRQASSGLGAVNQTVNLIQGQIYELDLNILSISGPWNLYIDGSVIPIPTSMKTAIPARTGGLQNIVLNTTSTSARIVINRISLKPITKGNQFISENLFVNGLVSTDTIKSRTGQNITLYNSTGNGYANINAKSFNVFSPKDKNYNKEDLKSVPTPELLLGADGKLNRDYMFENEKGVVLVDDKSKPIYEKRMITICEIVYDKYDNPVIDKKTNQTREKCKEEMKDVVIGYEQKLENSMSVADLSFNNRKLITELKAENELLKSQIADLDLRIKKLEGKK